MSYVAKVPPLPDDALKRMGKRNLTRQERQNFSRLIARRKKALRLARTEEERGLQHAIEPEEPAQPI